MTGRGHAQGWVSTAATQQTARARPAPSGITMGLPSLSGRLIVTVLENRSAVTVIFCPTTTGFKAPGAVTPVTLDVSVPSKQRRRTVPEEVLGENATESAETVWGTHDGQRGGWGGGASQDLCRRIGHAEG